MSLFNSRNLIIIVSLITIGCTTEAPDPISDPPPNQYIEEGKNLVKGLAACGFCHGETSSPRAILSGGQILEDDYGDVIVPNITPSESGIKDWDTISIIKFFRSAQKPDEEFIAWRFHKGFEWMADQHILAIVSYLKSMPSVDNDVRPRSLSIVAKNTTGFFESEREVRGYVPDIDKSYQLEYGQYLVDHVARCGVCHTSPSTVLDDEKYLGGGWLFRKSSGEKTAPDITQSETSGIGSWSEEEIVQYLQSGRAPNGRESDPEFCPVEFYRNALPEDLVSIAKYLKTVPAVN